MSKRKLFVIRAAAARSLKASVAAFAWSVVCAAPSYAQAHIPATTGAAVSRAEVIADLVLWRRAGLDRYDLLYRSYSPGSEAYLAAYREYLRLRNGEAFQAEVRKASQN